MRINNLARENLWLQPILPMFRDEPTPDHPMGEGWGRLTSAYAATRTFQQRVLGGTSGAGTTGVDDAYAAAYFEGVGAEVMGAAMFGFHSFPDDPEWRGWWGDEPPFGYPVFVLTHSAPRPPLEMAGGTTFHFRSGAIEDVLAEAVAAADGQAFGSAAASAPRAPSCGRGSSTTARRHRPDPARRRRAPVGRPARPRPDPRGDHRGRRERHDPRHLHAARPVMTTGPHAVPDGRRTSWATSS